VPGKSHSSAARSWPVRSSPRLGATIAKQAIGHRAFREPTCELRRRAASHKEDDVVVKLELHLVPRVKTGAITKLLRDHHLSFDADAGSLGRRV
jgi:hypothetical protein